MGATSVRQRLCKPLRVISASRRSKLSQRTSVNWSDTVAAFKAAILQAMRLDRGSPIRRNAAKQAWRAKRIGADRVLLAEAQRLVAGDLEIEQVVHQGVGANATDMRGKCALDQCPRCPLGPAEIEALASYLSFVR